jgi:hypothetical protein
MRYHFYDIVPNDLRGVEYYWKVMDILVPNQYIGGLQSVE